MMQNCSDNLPSYLQTTSIAQILSVGEKRRLWLGLALIGLELGIRLEAGGLRT